MGLLYHFKHFFHGYREIQDQLYWRACVPISYQRAIGVFGNNKKHGTFDETFEKLKKTSNWKTWNATVDNLVWVGCKNADNSYHCNLDCSHEEYLQHIGMSRNEKD